MRIVKQGDKNKIKPPKQFACVHCGCEFVAEYGEYRPTPIGTASGYECNCPCCGRVVSSKDTIG